MATKLSHRFFAIFFAILFLLTSSFIAIGFILGNIESHHNSTDSNTSSDQSSSSSPYTSAQQGQQLPAFTPVATVSQLEEKDLVVGTGAQVKSGDTVSAEYSGALASTGVIFQTSSSPVSFSLSGVIIGWRLGIPGMKVGGTRQLLIPAALAYGANPPSGSGIPANANLVFNVTVKSISGS